MARFLCPGPDGFMPPNAFATFGTANDVGRFRRVFWKREKLTSAVGADNVNLDCLGHVRSAVNSN